MKAKHIEDSYSTFNSRVYLEEYYSHLGSENENLLAFYAKIYKHFGKNFSLLEFSGGPTIYSLISAAGKVKEIDFCDYLKSNRDEVKLWKKNSDKAFNWDIYFKRALELEGRKVVDNEAIDVRKTELREKLKKIVRCNAFKQDPINKTLRGRYDIINANFVLESITPSEREWEQIIMNVTSMLKNGGILIMNAIKGASYYKVGSKSFPAVNISEEKVKKTLNKLGFKMTYLRSVAAEELNVDSTQYEGYKGFIFTIAIKK